MITPTTGLNPDKGCCARQVHVVLRVRRAAEGKRPWLFAASPNLIKVVFDAVKKLPGAPAVQPSARRPARTRRCPGTLGEGASSAPKGSSAAATSGGSTGDAATTAGAAGGAAAAAAAAGGAAATDAAAGSASGNGQYAAMQATSLSVNAGAGSGPSLAALFIVLLVITPAIVVLAVQYGRGRFGKSTD